jgi:hypothetical protein
MTWQKIFLLLQLAAMLVVLPLAGVALAGHTVSPYLAFPPLTDFVTHAPFSWSVFMTLAVLVSASIAPFFICLVRNRPQPGVASRRHQSLEWWAWLGVVILALAWWIAWNRFEWFEVFQEYTFTPIWIGYVLLINGITRMRTGSCMLTNRPIYLLGLFLLSAVFWWLFEYLNRFVQNWHYVGLTNLGPWEYFWQATLPFSTVLPAVLSTRDCLGSFPRLSAGLSRGPSISVRTPKCLAALSLIAAGLGLAGIGVWPERLYPMLWLAPLLILVSLQVIHGDRTLFHPLADGDWRGVWLAALAALACGFFWELWNYKSLAHWEYSIPYVDRFELFHMPLLGYAGYLPFGLECLAVAGLLEGDDASRTNFPAGVAESASDPCPD